MPHARRWTEISSAEFASLDPQSCVAVLPVGAVEQHGPHLPVGVDALICQSIVDRLIATAPADVSVVFLPLLAVGKSNEHLAFPGTLSLSTETLLRTWIEIGECVARSGLRKLLLLNSHGGQVQALDIVARELRVAHRMFVVTASTYSFGPARELFPDDEMKHGIHGGSVETSMMLHLHPELVRNEHRANFTSTSVQIERDYRYLRPEGASVGFGWQIQDLNPAGACGNSLDGDADRGEQIVAATSVELIELLREIARFPLDFIQDFGGTTGQG